MKKYKIRIHYNATDDKHLFVSNREIPYSELGIEQQTNIIYSLSKSYLNNSYYNSLNKVLYHVDPMITMNEMKETGRYVLNLTHRSELEYYINELRVNSGKFEAIRGVKSKWW